MMTIYFTAVLLLLSQQEPVAGFLQPLPTHQGIARRHATLGMGAETTADVSVPYDAAARLAYDQWRAEFNKGDFDADRFQIFKDNYEIVTVANMKAKKKARDEGTVSISLMSLNEFGDMTQDEYLGAQQQQGDPPSTGAPQPTKTSDILGKAVAAAELQTEASNALEEAFDALAVEEQKLVETLGLDSVDELEVALDSLEGIAPDGGELETSTLAREARIRDAYLNWCKEFNKEIDESRFPAFSQNFLFMEQYTKTTGKEMALNKYADYSKDEYEAAMNAEKSKTPESPPKLETPVTPPKAETLVKDPVPPKKDPPAPEKQSKPVEAKSPEVAKSMSPPPTAVAEETVAAPKESSPAPASVPATSSAPDSGPVLSTEDLMGAAKGMSDSLGGVLSRAAEFAKNANENIKKSIDEGLKEIEDAAETPEARKERLERLAKEQQEIAEAAAFARAERAKVIQEKAKMEQEKREQIEKERSERLKQSEKEAAKAQASTEAAAIAAAKAEEERQATIAAQRAYFEAQAAEEARKKAREFEMMGRKRQPPPFTTQKKTTSPNSLFANILSKVEKPEAEPQKPPAPKKAPMKKPPVKKAVAKTPTFSLFSDFAKKLSSKPVTPPPPPSLPPKSAPVATPKSSVKKSSPTFSLFPSAEKKKAAAVGKLVASPKVNTPQPRPTLSLFGPSAPKPKPPAPAKAEPTTNAPAFSLFENLSRKNSPKPKQAMKKVQSSPTLSLFVGGKKPPAKVVAPAPRPSPAAPAFSFFKTPPTKKAPEPAPAPAQPASPSFSLFGSPPKAAKEQPPKIPNRGGTISLFGAGKKIPAKKPEAQKAKPAFSLFGAPKQAQPAAAKAPPKNIPVLSRWKQNPDGSITGRVSNSPNFRPNTEITTSPVRKGAKPESVVKTGSGSQYYLS